MKLAKIFVGVSLGFVLALAFYYLAWEGCFSSVDGKGTFKENYGENTSQKTKDFS